MFILHLLWDLIHPFTLIFWRIRQTTVTVMYLTLMNDSDRETAVFIQNSHIHKKVVLNENTLILNLFNCAIFRILYHVTLVLISMVTMVILCSPPLSHLILSLVEQMAQMTFLHPVWISPVFFWFIQKVSVCFWIAQYTLCMCFSISRTRFLFCCWNFTTWIIAKGQIFCESCWEI